MAEDRASSSARARARWIGFGVAGLCVLAVVLAVTLGSNEAVCAKCHSGQTKALATTVHEDVSCYDCHVRGGGWGMVEQKTFELTNMYPLGMIGAGLQSPARPVASSSCLRCHEDINEGVNKAAGLRIKHSVCAAGSSCDKCHAAIAHGKATRWRATPIMEDCISCHKTRGATEKCDVCHPGRSDIVALSKTPWEITHGPNWSKMHGMGDLASCSTCHPSNFCKKCHGVSMPHGADFGLTHGGLAKDDRSACMKCHQSSAFCDACHGMEMPHPAGFLKTHSSSAKGDSDPSCSRCHIEGDCARCHQYHAHPGGATGVPKPKPHRVTN